MLKLKRTYLKRAFSKNPVSQATRNKYAGRVRFLSANELYGHGD